MGVILVTLMAGALPFCPSETDVEDGFAPLDSAGRLEPQPEERCLYARSSGPHSLVPSSSVVT